MKTVNLADFVSPAFDDVFWDIQEHGHTFYWLNGGRGSTKSSFISVVAPTLLIQNPDMHMVVLRKVGNTAKRSIYPQMQWGISQLGLDSEFLYKVSPLEMTYKETGQKIYFMGVDDPQKIKSIKPPFGYVGIVWFEELDAFGGMEEIRNVNQSLLRGGPKYWEFCSYNPPKSRDAWVNIELLSDDKDRLVHHSDYRSVPRAWLGEEFFDEAEKLRARNRLLYEHEYLGEITGTGGAVFDNVEEVALSDAEVAEFDHTYAGLDYGFAMDPLAYVDMNYDSRREILTIYDEIYQPKLSNSRAVELIAPRLGSRRVIADSAEPKSIADMRSLGLHISPARKGRDSVEHGLKWLQSLQAIRIDKRRCPNLYREFVSYEYERDRTGAFVSAYPDKNNHGIDATRYALSEVMRHGGIRFLK